MTDTTALFRRAIEYLYPGKLPAFLEMATECLEAVFEDEQPSTLTPEQKKNRVAQRAKAVSVLKPKYPNIDFNKEDTDKILGMYANYIRFGTIYPNSPNNPKPIPQATPQAAPQQQQQPNTPAQPATPSNAQSAQHGAQNQNRAPAPQPQPSNAQNQQQQKKEESKDGNLYRAFRNTVCQAAGTALTSKADWQKNNEVRNKCNAKWGN